VSVDRRKALAAWVSVGSNSSLMALKLCVGFLTGSVSVLSEAVHSGIDLLAAVVTLTAVKSAALPADENHPYGHGKFENVSGTLEAALILGAAIWIIVEAVQKIRHPQPLGAPFWGVVVMLISAAANWRVSRYLLSAGQETESVALVADASHLRTDVYTSAGVMAGLAAITVGRWFFPRAALHLIDPIAALFVAALILRAAVKLTVQAGRDLVDFSLPPAEEADIRTCIDRFAGGSCGYHKLRTRKSGPQRFVEFHLLVDPAMSVVDSHRITEKLETCIREKLPETNVLVHIEPCDGVCSESCEEGCLLTPEQRAERQQTAAGKA
jgi:cation diffusion facilitator family transporter